MENPVQFIPQKEEGRLGAVEIYQDKRGQVMKRGLNKETHRNRGASQEEEAWGRREQSPTGWLKEGKEASQHVTA